MNKINFKNLLKKEIEKKLEGNRQYFSREDLCKLIPEGRLDTLNRYLVDFNKDGILYGAGRGWYSFVKQLFELDRQPIKKIVTAIEKKYPRLSFSIWSTEQLKSFAHHMLARFVTFVYLDRDAMGGVYDFLRDSGYDVWLNPRGNDARKFSVGEKTVVIRSTITREPLSGRVANIEKIVVDFFVEAAALNFVDEDEYYRTLGNVLTSGRIDIGALLNYAKRRKFKTKGLIERIKSI
jgi:hypothetical protein